MNMSWSLLIDLGVIGIALFCATFIRMVFPFLQKFRVPNSLTAGFLLLFFYNYGAPRFGMSTFNLESMVFHLLGISFAAMSLRKTDRETIKREVFPVAMVLLTQHIVQAIIGLVLTWIFISTIFPDLFPGFGLLFPLGFALGPGQALAFGHKWSSAGFTGAESVGVTFAAMGFFFACFGGIALINIGIKKKWIRPEPEKSANPHYDETGMVMDEKHQGVGMKLVSLSEAIDTLSLNVAIVFGVYLFTFLTLKALGFLLHFAGPTGDQFSSSLWAITYVFAGLVAMVIKNFLRLSRLDHLTDNGALTRISGFSVDFLVAGSLGVISITVVKHYWAPILMITLAGSVAIIFLMLWMSSRMFKQYTFYRMITIYGAMTGTLATGLALLRVVDSEFKTPVASDHMYAAGLMFPLAIPFILMADFPANYHTTGNPLWIKLTIAVLVGYTAFIAITYIMIKNKNNRGRKGVWLDG